MSKSSNIEIGKSSKKLWLKNEGVKVSEKNEFCPVECFESKGNIFWPERSKSKLDEDDILIGEYWFDGRCWCYSLFETEQLKTGGKEMNNLDEFQETMATETFGLTKKEALKKGICINCKEEALSKCYSDAGRKEYLISGLCELCFDKIMGG